MTEKFLTSEKQFFEMILSGFGVLNSYVERIAPLHFAARENGKPFTKTHLSDVTASLAALRPDILEAVWTAHESGLHEAAAEKVLTGLRALFAVDEHVFAVPLDRAELYRLWCDVEGQYQFKDNGSKILIGKGDDDWRKAEVWRSGDEERRLKTYELLHKRDAKKKG